MIAETADPVSSSSSRTAAEKETRVAADLVPIVDTHHHLWDLKKVTLPWLKTEAVKPIARSFVMSDYKKATAGLNVVKPVYLEVHVTGKEFSKIHP